MKIAEIGIRSEGVISALIRLFFSSDNIYFEPTLNFCFLNCYLESPGSVIIKRIISKTHTGGRDNSFETCLFYWVKVAE